MYTVEDLQKYDYFKHVDISHALDSLTGVISRGYILGYTKYLIENNIPFYMGIIDIDNFKLVNDNFGHDFGDKCLTDIAQNLSDYFKQDGLVGRYGGDEFIFLYFGDNSYDNIHNVIENMYNCNKVLRKSFKYKNLEHFLTSTTGCSTFPKDAQNYVQLFANVDKALYRGKAKGRNCFIIYLKEKHENIDVHKKETSSLHLIYSSINQIFENEQSLPADKVVQNALDYLTNILHFSQALYIKSDGQIITNSEAINKNIEKSDFDFISNLFECEIYIPKDAINARKNDEHFKNLFDKYKFLTFMASKIQRNKNLFGYLILLEGKVERIWQEKDIAILMYIDRQIQLLYV